MASNKFLLLALVFATVLLITSEIVAAKELASKQENELEDAKYGGDDNGYYNGGGGNYNNGGGGNYNNGGGGNYNNGGGRYNNGGGRYNNGGGRYNGGGGGRGRGNYCRHGCCGRSYYNQGCRCCSTLAEATAYKQANHN